MVTVSLVIFLVGRDLYWIETRVVKEVLWVPELFWNHSLPTGMAGMFSYRGTVIPVFDLHQWADGGPRKLRLSHQVIVVEWKGRVAGLICDKVQDVTSLLVDDVDEISLGATAQGSHGDGVVAIEKVDGQSVKMLDLSLVLQDLEAPGTRVNLNSLASGFTEGKGFGQTDLWIPVSSKGFEEMTQEEFHLLQERAVVLAESERVVDAQKWITLAVVRLNGEYVGLDPLVVREFAELHDIVPVPCCPNFVLGHMNLRGEVLTVFDLRYVLNMPIVENLPLSQVAVIQLDTCLMGIAVQEVLDCVSCQSNSGSSSRMGGEGDSFMNVVSQYRGNALKYLDVSHLITSKVLEVYEEV